MLELSIVLPNGAKIVPTKQQNSAIRRLLFEEEEVVSPKIEELKEKRKYNKRKTNNVTGQRRWTPEEKQRLMDRWEELKKTTPLKKNGHYEQPIFPTLAKEFNRSEGSLSVLISNITTGKQTIN
jgi:hypothetical protein